MIHFEWILYIVEGKGQLHSFACGYPGFPAPLVERLLFPVGWSWTLVQSHLTACQSVFPATHDAEEGASDLSQPGWLSQTLSQRGLVMKLSMESLPLDPDLVPNKTKLKKRKGGREEK